MQATETQQINENTPPNGNGYRQFQPVINETVVLPKKGKMRYRLIDPAGRRSVIDERKPDNLGRYKNDKYQIDCPIDGSMLWNGGTEVWIDVTRGIQITYDGLRGWVGIDGKFSYKAEVGKMWALVLAAKLGDLMKYAKIAILLILVAVASPFIALLLKG